MRETIVESVKAFISPNFIKIQHFKHHGKRYTKKGSTYVTGPEKTGLIYM